MNKVKNYIETGRALQAKYDELRQGIVTRKNILEEDFKSIVTPLREIETQLKKPLITASPVETPHSGDDTAKTLGLLASKYLRLNTSKTIKNDTTFGFYTDKDGYLYIGNSPIIVEDDNISFPNGETFEGTPGLWELLTMVEPKNFTRSDLKDYENIILKTFAYRHNNDPNDPGIKSSGGTKYKKIIRPILTKNGLLKGINQPRSLASELATADVTGSGLRKILSKTPAVEYVYWNTLDELLDRLYIAWGEIKSGNNSPYLHNEIVNILQEIKEI